LRGYPYEQYGMIRGKLTYIPNSAYRGKVFVAKVYFEHFEMTPDHEITLKNGMQADTEIITEKSSLLQRFFGNTTKMMNSHYLVVP